MAMAKYTTASRGQKDLTRRNVLKALPISGVALAAPGIANAEAGDTPILRLFQKHQAIMEAAQKHVYSGGGKDEDREREQLYCQYSDKIEAEIMDLPCTCAADFAAKTIVDTCRGSIFPDWETGAIWQEARALTGWESSTGSDPTTKSPQPHTIPTPEDASAAADPVMPLYRQWDDARKDWHRWADFPGNGNWDMPESKAAESRQAAAFKEMIEMTPTSMAGIAALAHVLWDTDGPSVVPECEGYQAQADTPGCKLMLAIWRAASGEQGPPPYDS